jgi:hypothetical protein
MLCVAGFGMVAGIAAVAHSTHSGGTNVMPGGNGGPAPPPVTLPSLSDSTQSTGTGGGIKSVDP